MRFHSAECRRADYAGRQRDRRAAARKGRCPACGRSDEKERKHLPAVSGGSVSIFGADS
jgi:hypothetical protein